MTCVTCYTDSVARRVPDDLHDLDLALVSWVGYVLPRSRTTDDIITIDIGCR